LILIIYAIIEFKIDKDSFLPLALITTICGWGLQDFFKGVVVRFNLWFNDLLCEGDFVNLSTHNVSGVVEEISLTSVNIRNLDGTILTIPILWFQSGAFENHRKIQEGNVSGRRMSRRFLIDVQSISVVTDEMYKELLDLKMENRDICKEAIKKYKEGHSDVLNINLFMEYLKGYLISLNEKIANNGGERFLVRLLDSTPEGLPLQISATTMEKDLLSFEQVQSEFVEHVLLSMKWFDLKLYQKKLD
jgi:miniconductance mechanosensitive channel